MGEQALGILTGLAETHPIWLVLLAFIVAFLESLAIVGILVPGIILLFIVGTLIGPEWTVFMACWLAASGGALLGDGLSFWLGWRYRARVPTLWPFSRRPELLSRARDQFHRHGGKAIVIARFIGPMRPIVPMIAGSMHVSNALFYRYAIPACIAWAPLYLLPGALFGASLELAAEFAGRLASLLAILVIGLWLLLWVTRQIYEFTARRSGWWLRSLIRWLRSHPRLGRLFGPLLEPGGREVLSVTLLGLLWLACLAVLLAVLLAAPFADTHWDADRQIASWAGSLRNHFADPVLAAIALATGSRAMLFLAGAFAVILLGLGRINATWHWAMAMIGGWFSGELLILLTGLMMERPEVMPSLGEVPFRPYLLACLVFGFFAVLLAKDLGARRRKWPYLATTLILGLSGFAHFYLGRASLPGLLAALALGLGWVAMIGIAYRQRASRRPHAPGLVLAFYGLALGAAVVNARSGLEALLEATELRPPAQSISRQAWQAGDWRKLPDRISSLGPFERHRFDLQLAAPMEAIEQALLAAGWQPVPEVRLGDLGSILIGRPDRAELPHLNKDFAGRPDDRMLRFDTQEGPVVLLRLWASGARLTPDGEPVWLGQVRAVEPGLFLGGLTRWYELGDRTDDAASILDRALPNWWQAAPEGGPRLYALPD